MANREPFPTEPEDFDADPRISFSRISSTYVLEDENGDEWEWLASKHKWVPVTHEDELAQQQQAYKVAGVDEDAPALDARKRKAQAQEDSGGQASKKQKPESEAPKERKNTAVYVTSLPLDTDMDEIHTVFSKYGVIAESLDSDAPRIKMYTDDKGKFKGEALIVYFRPESVQLAINMLDETDFRLGQQLSTGPMRVREAEASYKAQKDTPLANTQEAKKKGTGANRDRQKVIKKTQEMNNRLADWDDDDPQAIPETSSRWDKVVVLKHMFTLAELEADAAAALDIKEDVREECEKFGAVTNVVLYDREEDGVITVRFSDARAASACIDVFDGRWFDGRQVEAYMANGKERFRKGGKDVGGDEERLEKFRREIEGES